ncbi:hypothetical protein GALL_458910 [mine drainage metagenome]|uniref:Uncharacterized protein n=1 Tax=mine drainage metagenome TaxID=410659 RepID=A0A1J5PLR9_9ZZZZ
MHTPLDDDVYRLWDDLADHGTQDMQAALALCLRTLCDWTGSQNGYWMGLVRLPHKAQRPDLLKGWRIGASVEMLRTEFTTPERIQHGTPIMQTPTADAAAQMIVATSGTFRSFSMCTGMFDPTAHEQTQHYSFSITSPTFPPGRGSSRQSMPTLSRHSCSTPVSTEKFLTQPSCSGP